MNNKYGSVRLLACFILFLVFVLNNTAKAADSLPAAKKISILYTPGHPLNKFVPAFALGAGIDGHEKGDNAVMLSPRNIKAMQGAGLKSLTYRLRTELGNEVWHWNPSGKWSDEQRRQGYWVSDSLPLTPISLSYGYRLPRRGSTFDQANNDGYSMITDGDSASFWKSNPYLDSAYTGDNDSLHPQWIAVDLKSKKAVNTLIIDWADPYAVDFRVEYAENNLSLFNDVTILDPYLPGLWKIFPKGIIKNCKGGKTVITLSDKPVEARLIRIVFTQSSHTALPGSQDQRDSMGYAVREVAAGLTINNTFADEVVHDRDNELQSAVYASTTDPWHRPEDIDTLTEQPGPDFIFKSRLDNSLPVLFTAGILYDTPDNASALVHYLKRRQYLLSGLELGEEPDGQYISPQDFAALYHQFADAVLKENDKLLLGGPSFQGITPYEDTTTAFTEKRWLKQFVEALKAKNAMDQFRFFSFEWYPFDNICDRTTNNLLPHPAMLADVINGLRPGILPAGVKVFITEYGYSVLGAEQEVTLEGGLLNADIIGRFLTLGGDRAFLYGYEPNTLMKEGACNWGNLMMFGLDTKGAIKYPTATYYSAQLYAGKWAQPAYDSMEVYPCLSGINNQKGEESVSAYALRSSKGKWSLLLINKQKRKSYTAAIEVKEQTTGHTSLLQGPADLYQYSRRQYQWKANGEKGHPDRDLPPWHRKLKKMATLTLPPFSISVIKEK